MANAQPTQIEGTPEQLAARLGQLPTGKRYRLVEVAETVAAHTKKPRVSAMGKYAGILNSEEFMRRKHEETMSEDSPIH